MSSAVVVVCHPDDGYPAEVALKARGFWFIEVEAVECMPRGVVVVWFANRPQVLALAGG